MLRPCRAFSVICRPPKLTVRCTVTLVRLISPDSDPEILAIVAMLEAHEIPCFVRGGGFGGLYPGVQINAFNTRDIMVPEEHAAAALDLVRDFEVQPSAPSRSPRAGSGIWSSCCFLDGLSPPRGPAATNQLPVHLTNAWSGRES